MRLFIGEAAPHEVYLDHLVVNDGAVLGGVDGVVDPDLAPGNEPVAEPVAAQGEIDIKPIPYRPTGDEPDLARTRRAEVGQPDLPRFLPRAAQTALEDGAAADGLEVRQAPRHELALE
jgi:hypothetical protein